MAKIVCSVLVFTTWNSLWDFCDLTQSDNSMNELHVMRLFISVRCRRRRPLDLLSTNGFGTGRACVMVRKPPYSFKRLVNVYKIRLNVYKIKR